MNVKLHIERLVFDRPPVSEAALLHVQAAIETELARLIAVGGGSAGLARNRTVRSVRGGDVGMTAGGDDTLRGRQIAGALYGGLAK